MKVNYDGIFRQESMALCNPEVIVIDDSSDDEEKVLVFPSEESPIKSDFFHPLPGSRGEAERGELGAHSETSASTADHHDVDDRPSAKRRQRELFRSSAGPFRDGKAAVALAMKSRRAKHAPPPTRLAELRRTYSYTDVYNMDETGFFLYNVPRGSLCFSSSPALKQDKAHITLALCTNPTGTDKLPLRSTTSFVFLLNPFRFVSTTRYLLGIDIK
ncbi:hypothetical protein PR003_g3056 [Phytophthora rubi]|uniref:DDE-1 domain-containing protein n=1 Tax=Phytophthora rubi TaxID=129364 RepID=A0A6A3NSQ8_9STRA|nr:hypothetical protein PR002_g1731 [Phytophthora rubi]KAE9046290.1 hypothetical protein PR002_g1730 [Phytophthora rubi]KAE9049819.1 hypothetical protein PR001_g2967 [Phytophthora rubi]KAE9049823.1 hypothetical protein PR001_g2968 [Phytophthora rubi]KAE9355041.1 hypothetical protein PR003_g3055 [Phytophthora rubi]